MKMKKKSLTLLLNYHAHYAEYLHKSATLIEFWEYSRQIQFNLLIKLLSCDVLKYQWDSGLKLQRN